MRKEIERLKRNAKKYYLAVAELSNSVYGESHNANSKAKIVT